MKIDGLQIPRGSVHSADVCVIGSGAAGITLARALAGGHLKVVLLEGGALEWTEPAQDDYRSDGVISQPAVLDNDFPHWSRLKQFGGSTNHWGGWCRPLDPQDFEKRPWVPHSGWPLSFTDLEPYYFKAAQTVQIDPFDFAEEQGRPAVSGVVTREFRYSPPTRFGDVYGEELFSASNMDVIFNASAARFDTRGSQVEKLVACNAATEFEVRAKTFVLACGGLENPRLLLNSDHQRPAGLANGSGWVGRGFMEHPHATIGLLLNIQDDGWLEPFIPKTILAPRRILTTTADFQRAAGLANFSCQLAERTQPAEGNEALALAGFAHGKKRAVGWLDMYVRSEMRPERSNRVELGTARDALGLRRLSLQVTFGQDDLASVVRSTEAVIARLSAEARGRGAIALERDEVWSADLGPACHHMGTTRMSANPNDGVVDANGRCHELHNLYIAGSSVFPTSGFANPTLTIVALALRLADHLNGGTV